MNIKTWQERMEAEFGQNMEFFAPLNRASLMQAEIDELRAALKAQPVQPALTDADILAINSNEVFFSESPSKYPEAGHGTQYHAGAPGVIAFARAVLNLRTGGAG